MDPRIDFLVEMLTRYRSELRQALEKVPADRREVRSGAAWSAANVIEHLTWTERGVTGLIARFLDGAPASQSNVRGGIQENGPAV